MQKYIFLIMTIAAQFTWGKEPFWLLKRHFDDSRNYYYVESLSTDQFNKPHAREEIRLQATKDAIRQVVGTESNFTTNTITTANNEQVSTVNKELFPQIELKNFTEQEAFIKDNKVYLLYAWPKVDAAAALEKAKNAAKVSKSLVRAIAKSNTQIVITSEPAGAEVFIDNLRWGTTPLVLDKKIAFGTHKFLIDHKRYKTVEFEDVIFESEKTIHRVLEPLNLDIYFTTNPSGANIIVDGEYKGTSPIKISFLVTDENYKKNITIEHESAVTQTLTLELDKDSSQASHIEMLLKGSKLHLAGCEPSPCKYNVSGVSGEIKDKTEKINLQPGPHTVRFIKEGYIIRDVSIVIEPGVDFGLEKVRLNKSEAKLDEYETRLKFQLGMGLAGGDFPLDRDVSYLGYDTNLSLILLGHIVLTAGGSIYSVEDTQDYDNSYVANASQTYFGAGINIADIRFLVLAKTKKWDIELNNADEKLYYKVKQESIKLDMPVTEYVRWHLEYTEFVDFKNANRFENGYGLGIAFEL